MNVLTLHTVDQVIYYSTECILNECGAHEGNQRTSSITLHRKLTYFKLEEIFYWCILLLLLLI